MNPNSLNLVVIETDPLLRRGLESWLTELPRVQSVHSFASYASLKAELSQLGEVDIFLLGGEPTLVSEIQLFLPKAGLLIIGDRPITAIPASKSAVVGYCSKARLTEELEPAISALAEGKFYTSVYPPSSATTSQVIPLTPWQLMRHNLRAGALQRIAHTLQNLPPKHLLSPWQRWVQEGRERELKSAQWLVGQVLFPDAPILSFPKPEEAHEVKQTTPHASISAVNIHQVLTEAITDKIRHPQQTLNNLSPIVMEIDILRLNKKRELLLTVLHHWQMTVQELKASDINPEQINYTQVIQNLWSESATGFLGRYFQIAGTNVLQQILTEADSLYLQIPQLPELLAHLLRGEPLLIDNAPWAVGSPAAMRQAELLIEHLILETANAVMQAVLNHFAHAEALKQQFYQHHLLATRDIERFRNDLSWQYRRWQYIDEPRAIFESYYPLMAITEMGIRQQKIYAPRTSELESLQGIRYAMTILWELQDAIAPRLKALASWLGSLLVYLLTNIVGRGIGLVGRGVMQGIGSAFQPASSRRIQG